MATIPRFDERPLQNTPEAPDVMTVSATQGMLLGELLMQKGMIAQRDLDRALQLQQQIGGRLGSILVRLGSLSEDALLPVLADQLGMTLLPAEELPVDFQELRAWLAAETNIDPDWWLDQGVLAWELSSGAIRCIARDPLENSIVEVVEAHFGEREIEWCLVRAHDLDRALEAFARMEPVFGAEVDDANQLKELAEEAPVIEFVNNLIGQAFEQRASDIHIEPEKRQVRIRVRIDGVLYDRLTLPMERYSAIAVRIKLISGMDIAEHRLPQDGQVETRVAGEEIDIRVSALPGVYGESIVMRLLPKEKQSFSLSTLGLATESLAQLSQWITQPHGIILVTGPTGSGKSTTLYSVLASINDGQRKIITVEDPVEYRLAGITQVQTLEDIGYSFARALRAILRQDPDVVMIGEIRDAETAEIAIQASLTGHLVLSTLHTNDAISAFTRLIDMGVEPFLVATPIRAVLAQRLVRRLCSRCAISADPGLEIQLAVREILPSTSIEQTANWLEPVGCDACQGTGFAGRTGIHELIPVTPELQRLIVHGASVTEMTQQARESGARSLRQDGFLKAYQGITSVEEVLRVTSA
jgi:general secretion pathway protein E